MKAFIISAAVLALFVSPVMAQKKAQTTGEAAQQGQQLPRLFVGPGIVQGNAVYDCTGKYLGSDPDVNIRQQMLRQGEAECGH